jgi:hypothetical protein
MYTSDVSTNNSQVGYQNETIEKLRDQSDLKKIALKLIQKGWDGKDKAEFEYYGKFPNIQIVGYGTIFFEKKELPVIRDFANAILINKKVKNLNLDNDRADYFSKKNP